MRGIEIGDGGEVVVEAPEVAAHLWITDRMQGVKMLLHVAAQLYAYLRQRVLIAQAPDDYRCVVLVTPDGCLRPLLQNGVESGVREVLGAVSEGHLINEIEAQRVRQLIETRLAGIVRQAQIVDRSLFHHVHIPECQRVADDLHGPWVGGVGIDATQLDALSVEFQHIALDGQLAESEAMGKALQHLSLLCQRGAERI